MAGRICHKFSVQRTGRKGRCVLYRRRMIKIQWDRVGTIFVIWHLERNGLSIARCYHTEVLARAMRPYLVYGAIRNNGSSITKWDIKAPALRRTAEHMANVPMQFLFLSRISLRPPLCRHEGNIYAVSDYGNVISCCGQFIRERKRERVQRRNCRKTRPSDLFLLRDFENAFPLHQRRGWKALTDPFRRESLLAMTLMHVP